MHEMVLAQDLLKKILDAAQAKGLKRLSYARVGIGEIQLHDKTELEELFIRVSQGTIAEGINLDIRSIPISAVCKECGLEFETTSNRLDCSRCNSRNIEITHGNEIIVEQLME